jgi:hypothetical protein
VRELCVLGRPRFSLSSLSKSALPPLLLAAMMKPAGSVVFSWTGREAVVWASHSSDPLADAEFRQAALVLQRNVTADGRHRCAPSGKTLCVAAALAGPRGASP